MGHLFQTVVRDEMPADLEVTEIEIHQRGGEAVRRQRKAQRRKMVQNAVKIDSKYWVAIGTGGRQGIENKGFLKLLIY